MKVGVIGYGFVGRATGEGFATNPENQVFWFDKFKSSPNTFDEVVEKSDFIFVCVPTPIFGDYSGMDMSIVEEVIDQIAVKISGTDKQSLAKSEFGKIIILKSTSLPGTIRKMTAKYPNVNFVMNPEFLTQIRANQDFLNPSRTILGSDSKDVAERVINIYKTILPETQKYIVMSPTSAELTKYMCNLVLASKVILANEFYNLAQKLDANYLEVQQGAESDPRIGSHLGAPGPDGDFGFGGACFPKDTIGILGIAKELGVDMSVLQAVWDKNLKVRKNKDWEDMPQAFKKTK
ncbi:MAG TPA: hypothetical protein VL401_02800 [Alphaproteobacteria bacterium]|jgi:UDPglucose 6-dehydrogenase|nr:hypothetical protein [Alphaproteobacteria bacterium]